MGKVREITIDTLLIAQNHKFEIVTTYNYTTIKKNCINEEEWERKLMYNSLIRPNGNDSKGKRYKER